MTHEYRLDPGGPQISYDPSEEGSNILPPLYYYSSVVEMFVVGYVMGFLSILLIVVIVTAHFHYPLMKSNYITQFISVLYMFMFRSVSLKYLFRILLRQASHDPYDFEYMEVMLPLQSWSVGKRSIYSVFQSIMYFLMHWNTLCALKLLFPSKLEMRMLSCLIIPIICASFLWIGNAWEHVGIVIDLCNAIQNCVNTALILIYLSLTLLWGVFINKKRAWQWEGGALGFGFLVILAGVAATALSFLQVLNSKLQWVEFLIPTILQWEAWLCFWWWVSSGMWSSQAREIERKALIQEKLRERRRQRRSKEGVISQPSLEKTDQQTNSSVSRNIATHTTSSVSRKNISSSDNSSLASRKQLSKLQHQNSASAGSHVSFSSLPGSHQSILHPTGNYANSGSDQRSHLAFVDDRRVNPENDTSSNEASSHLPLDENSSSYRQNHDADAVQELNTKNRTQHHSDTHHSESSSTTGGHPDHSTALHFMEKMFSFLDPWLSAIQNAHNEATISMANSQNVSQHVRSLLGIDKHHPVDLEADILTQNDTSERSHRSPASRAWHTLSRKWRLVQTASFHD